MSPSKHPSRRRVLAAGTGLAVAGLAGCSTLVGTSKGATEVVLHNQRAAPISVALVIAGSTDAEPRVDRTVTVGPHERARPTASDQLPVGTDYTVEVDVEGGPAETFEWQDVRLALAPLHVVVDGSSNVLFALQAG